jgi:hypothetical protein
MDKNIKPLSLVPKPRSAFKTVEWLPALLKVEGKNWDFQNDRNERPIRREYLKFAHPYDEFKDDDPEINARMEFARYQTLGLAFLDKSIEEDGTKVVVTNAGKALALQENKDELMLRQLLKWQFPSHKHSGKGYETTRVFPLEVILRILQKYGSLNRLEVAFSVFTCTNIKQIEDVFYRIDAFKDLVQDMPANKHKEVFMQHFAEYNGNTGNKPETYLGNYDDTLFRYLEFTGLFETSGRGYFTRIYIPDRAKVKFDLLLKDYEFEFFENYRDVHAFYNYFGDPYARRLPWDTKEAMGEIIGSKLALLETKNVKFTPTNIHDASKEELQLLDIELTAKILEVNEREFIEITSKTPVERAKIIEKFRDIEDGNEDLAALWMEVNTWKSLVAMSGQHFVKRNFRVELDLSPRSFAAGTSNTPDMEFYNQKYIIIPEVSIQRGVQQWITEGSSVVEHVYKFMEVKNGKRFFGIDKVEQYMNVDNLKAIYGLFIAQKLNHRLIWQFYVLARESWLGEPISIIPMKLSTYVRILEYMYQHDVPAIAFEELVVELAQSTLCTTNFEEWLQKQEELVSSFTTFEPVKA